MFHSLLVEVKAPNENTSPAPSLTIGWPMPYTNLTGIWVRHVLLGEVKARNESTFTGTISHDSLANAATLRDIGVRHVLLGRAQGTQRENVHRHHLS